MRKGLWAVGGAAAAATVWSYLTPAITGQDPSRQFPRGGESYVNRSRLVKAAALELALAQKWSDTDQKAFADRALVIRRLDVVDELEFAGECGKLLDPDHQCWTFAALMEWTFQKAGAGDDAEGLIRKWVKDPNYGASLALNVLEGAWNDDHHQPRPLTKIPLQLQAVVMRLDKGGVGGPNCAGGNVCGAEVRFVYQGLGNNGVPYLGLIYELALPPLKKDDYQKFAARWVELADAAKTPEDKYKGELMARLKDALSLFPVGAPPAARLRALRVNKQGIWMFGQYRFGAGGLVEEDLNQQLAEEKSAKCLSEASGLKPFLANHWTDIQASKFEYESEQCPGRHCRNVQVTARVEVDTKDLPVLTLDNALLPAGKKPEELDWVRFALSVNSCVGCHGAETNPEAVLLRNQDGFNQIKPRVDGKPSLLSVFLAGGAAAQAEGQEPMGGLFDFTPKTVEGCGPTHVTQRHYNDLVRRREYLDVLLHDLKSTDPDSKWQQLLDGTGLTAKQAH